MIRLQVLADWPGVSTFGSCQWWYHIYFASWEGCWPGSSCSKYTQDQSNSHTQFPLNLWPSKIAVIFSNFLFDSIGTFQYLRQGDCILMVCIFQLVIDEGSIGTLELHESASGGGYAPSTVLYSDLVKVSQRRWMCSKCSPSLDVSVQQAWVGIQNLSGWVTCISLKLPSRAILDNND